MAGSTSGGISDLAFVMNMRIDESSVTDAMKTLGDMKSQVNAFRMEHGIDGGVEQKKAAELEKEARFQVEFNQLLKEEAAEKAAIAARDAMIAQGREQHLAEQKRLLLEYLQLEERSGQVREAAAAKGRQAEEARFQAEFNQLLKEEAAEKSAIAARDSAIAQGREQHLAEQKRLLLESLQLQEKAGQAREAASAKDRADLAAAQARDNVESAAIARQVNDRRQAEDLNASWLIQQTAARDAAHNAENQRIASESIANQTSLDAQLEARQRLMNWTQGALATQRQQEEQASAAQLADAQQFHAAESALEERANAQWMTMQAARRNADPYGGNAGGVIASGGSRIAAQIAAEQAAEDAIEQANATRMAGIMAAIDGEIRLGQTQQAHSDDAERRNAQRLAGIMAAADAELRVGLAIDAEVNAIEGDMTRALRRTLNIEDQINFDYQRRLEAIDAIQGATAQQTAELRLQAAAVRDAATQTAINAGQIGGIGAAGLTGNRIQEFGRGFEDFTVGFSMAKTNIEGIAMGLRGSANNAAQLAASFDPMVGATVAIGASLATVIVPMVARWLWDTKALAEAQDAWNDKLKESGKEQMKVADALAKMRGTIREDADAKPGEKGKKIVDDVKKAENDALAAKEKGSSRQLALNTAEQKAAEATAKKKKLEQERDYALIDATVAAGANLAAGGLNPERAAESKASTDALYIKQAEYDLAVKEAELSESAAKNARKNVADTKTEMETTAEAEKAIKLKYGADIAKAQKEIQADAKEKLQEQLDDANDKAEKNAIKSAERQFEEDVKNIKALKLSAAEENEMVSDAAKIGRLKIERAEDAIAKKEQAKQDKEEARINKYEDMQQRIDADAGKATKSKEDDIMAAYNKRTEEINRLEGDKDADKLAREKLHASNLATFTSKMDQEQAAQNDKLAVKRIDAELQANADQQDALKESMDKAGNAAGPSAAMVSGTQAAESAINRALSGSQSVEGTMKAQLKVLQEIHKDLQKQKQAKTVSL